MILVERAHGDDVGKRRRIERSRHAIVAGRGNDDEAGVPGVLHRVEHRLRILGSAQAQVDHARAVGHRAIDRLRDREVVAAAVWRADLVGQNHRVGRHADHSFIGGGIAGRVVHRGGNGPRDVRAVAVIVHRIAVVVHEVPPADELRCEIGMGVVDAGVNDGDGNVGALRHRPGFGRVDVGIRCSDVEAQELAIDPGEAKEHLPGVVQRPLFAEVVVARHHRRCLALRDRLRELRT